MIEDFRVYAAKNDETLERILSNRTATGQLFIQANNYYFPTNTWNDFVAVVLNWWVTNALSLDEAAIEVENRFMDGPYSYRARREPGTDTISVVFVRDSYQELSKKIEISYKDYLNSLHRGAESFLNEIGSVSDKDLEELRENLVRLVNLKKDLNT